jgi:hypothetical protein
MGGRGLNVPSSRDLLGDARVGVIEVKVRRIRFEDARLI